MDEPTLPSDDTLSPQKQIAARAQSVMERWQKRIKPVGSGKPERRTEAMIEEICDRLACGESLSRICQDDHIAAYATVKRWRMNDPDLKARMNAAYEELAFTIREIAMEMTTGGDLALPTVNENRLAWDSLKWQMSKLNRVDFGEKVDITSGGKSLTIVSSLSDQALFAPIEADFVEVAAIEDNSANE